MWKEFEILNCKRSGAVGERSSIFGKNTEKKQQPTTQYSQWDEIKVFLRETVLYQKCYSTVNLM